MLGISPDEETTGAYPWVQTENRDTFHIDEFILMLLMVDCHLDIVAPGYDDPRYIQCQR